MARVKIAEVRATALAELSPLGMEGPAVNDLLVSRTILELRHHLDPLRADGRSIGFVPTMGALHEGHGSLVRASVATCDVTVASIFVNPMQFGPKEDLARYPRQPREDMKLLESLGCRHVFMPETSEMYPSGFRTRVVMEGLVDVLCGQSRPTHFAGVLTVVLKLLNAVEPRIAFFGRKDYQQALVIRRMVHDLGVRSEIRTCPIVREPDGLALSSRNAFLSSTERSEAPALRQALTAMNRAFLDGRVDAEGLLSLGREHLSNRPALRIDYLEVRHPETLELRTESVVEGDLVAIAAWLGKTRLIDNLLLGVDT